MDMLMIEEAVFHMCLTLETKSKKIPPISDTNEHRILVDILKVIPLPSKKAHKSSSTTMIFVPIYEFGLYFF